MTEAETMAASEGDLSTTEIPRSNSNGKLTDGDFVQAAGLQRSEHSGKKSSVEKLLEQSLNTTDEDENVTQQQEPSSQGSLMNGISSSPPSSPTTQMVGVKTSPERPQNLKSDQFIQEAGLSRTGNVPRKSTMERLLEDQLKTGDENSQIAATDNDKTTNQKSPRNRYPIQRSSTIAVVSPTSPTSSSSDISLINDSRRRFSSSASIDSGDGGKPRNSRRSSIYEQKQMDVPTAVVGNRIASRTQNLFKQYEKDMAVHESKPLPNVNASDPSRHDECTPTATITMSRDDVDSINNKTKVDLVREEKARELEEIRRAYHERLQMEEQEENERRKERLRNQELKSSKQLGAVKGRYLSVANADPLQNPENDEAESDNEENQQLVDKNGELIEKSGGKERVVSSTEGVKNIKALFGGKQQSTWQKPSNVEAETPSVDASSVNSARSMFKNFDQQKQSNGDGKSFNRPTVKKRDAKELMEQRKKATYGDDDADIQDGVVKKSVVIDQEEIASSNRKEALNKYKELESSKNTDNNNAQKNRPTNRLMSDNDVKDEFDRRSESISSSVASSEQGDVGYEGSVSPCSPNSEMSDDYISDETPKDEKVLNESAFEESREEVEVNGEQ